MDKNTVYFIKVFYSEEDSCFIATGTYPGLSAFGATPDEALLELSIALKAILDVASNQSKSIAI